MGETTTKVARDALGWLPTPLVTVLAALRGAPTNIAVAVLQFLPFAYRAALEDQGLVVIRGEGRVKTLHVTETGWRAIEMALGDKCDEDDEAQVNEMLSEIDELAQPRNAAKA